ncbi:MAG: DnaJ domain-containing protein, partial [Oscillospiraceae bacterium]|nr:DnaJ domain-containing protein [Oscillospiraceae bacterium]
YYKILGFDTNRISLEQLKIAFREQAKQYHPDVNRKNRMAEERFKDINEAYRVLSNGTSKRKYDRKWHAYVGKRLRQEELKGEKGSVYSDFSRILFGENAGTHSDVEPIYNTKTKKKVAVKGDNVKTEINVEIKDAFYGQEKKIALRTVEGKMKTFNVKIPSGIRDGEKIRLLGQGKPGAYGGKNGDLFIKIKIENTSEFRLEGCDLLTDLYLSPWEAALGKRVNISSINETVSLYIPPGVQSGERIKIPNKGYQDGQGGRGHLVAEIKTVVPKKLSVEEKELFQKLSNVSEFKPRG